MKLTHDDLTEARMQLGIQWGLGRPVGAKELARLFGLKGKDPEQTIFDWEDGRTVMSGPARLAMEALLTGWKPRGLRARLGLKERIKSSSNLGGIR